MAVISASGRALEKFSSGQVKPGPFSLRSFQSQSPTAPTRQAVGAHYGWKDWLAQRITALILVVFTVLFLAIGLWNGGFDYTLWKALFANAAWKVVVFLAVLALCWHAWIGVRDIWMDYVKPVAVRLTLEVLTLLALVAYVGWTIGILWGAK